MLYKQMAQNAVSEYKLYLQLQALSVVTNAVCRLLANVERETSNTICREGR